MNLFQERRKHPRVRYPHFINLQPIQPSKSGNVFVVIVDSMNGTGIDISEGGLQVELNESMKPGTILKIIFKIDPPDGQSHEAYVKVVWSEKTTLGVSFIMLEEATRRQINSFIGTTGSKGGDL